MRRLCTRIHVRDGREGIIKYDMVLRGYSTSARVKNQSNTSSMKWGVTKVHSNGSVAPILEGQGLQRSAHAHQEHTLDRRVCGMS